jgi:hypothetical protein
MKRPAIERLAVAALIAMAFLAGGLWPDAPMAQAKTNCPDPNEACYHFTGMVTVESWPYQMEIAIEGYTDLETFVGTAQ